MFQQLKAHNKAEKSMCRSLRSISYSSPKKRNNEEEEKNSCTGAVYVARAKNKK